MNDDTIMFLCFLALGGYAFIKIKPFSNKGFNNFSKNEKEKIKNIVKERKKKIEYWKAREIELKQSVPVNSKK